MSRGTISALRSPFPLSRRAVVFVRRVSDDEAASLRSQLEALRAQSQQDDAYKLQTMQYLRKYEGELQKKEVQLTELRTRLEQASGGASQET